MWAHLALVRLIQSLSIGFDSVPLSRSPPHELACMDEYKRPVHILLVHSLAHLRRRMDAERLLFFPVHYASSRTLLQHRRNLCTNSDLWVHAVQHDSLNVAISNDIARLGMQRGRSADLSGLWHANDW